MKLLDRYRLRKSLRAEVKRQIAAERNTEAPLREFAYLDDVSLYSLYSSRFRGIPESHKDSRGQTSQTDLTTEAGIGFGGASAKGGSKWSRTKTQQSEVVSKSNIQAAFRKFLEFERSRLRLEPARGQVPSFAHRSDRSDLESQSGHPRSWLISVEDLPRGSLIEIEVEVRATKLFSINSMFKLFTNLARNSPGLFGGSIDSSQMEAIREGIEEFLAGLIPLRCNAPDYVMVPTETEYLIVHRALYEQTPPHLRRRAYPLTIVGLTEEKLYWRDIRRVVFSGARFQMLARVNRPGVWPDWEELKVIDLIEEVNPSMARLLRDGMRGAVRSATQQQGETAPSGASEPSPSAEEVGAEFARSYLISLFDSFSLDHKGMAFAISNLPKFERLQLDSAIHRAEIFSEVEEVVATVLGEDLDPNLTGEVRDRFLNNFSPPENPITPAEYSEEAHEAHLEVEVIALYW